jgi:hypothetical protein
VLCLGQEGGRRGERWYISARGALPTRVFARNSAFLYFVLLFRAALFSESRPIRLRWFSRWLRALQFDWSRGAGRGLPNRIFRALILLLLRLTTTTTSYPLGINPDRSTPPAARLPPLLGTTTTDSGHRVQVRAATRARAPPRPITAASPSVFQSSSTPRRRLRSTVFPCAAQNSRPSQWPASSLASLEPSARSAYRIGALLISRDPIQVRLFQRYGTLFHSPVIWPIHPGLSMSRCAFIRRRSRSRLFHQA